MTLDQLLLLLVIAFTMAAFVREWLPIDLVALTSLALLLLFGLVTPEEGVSGFANEAVITVMMIFVLSEGLLKSGLISKLAHKLAAMSGDSHTMGSVMVMTVAGVLSAFINNVAALTIFMPVTIHLANHYRVSPSKVLLPLSYATIFGGTCTLIGTSTNLLISSLAGEYGFRPFTMFELASVGVPLFVIGMGYNMFVMMRLLPARSTPESLAEDYLEGYLSELEVTPSARIVGQTLVEARVTERFRVTVLEIVRGDSRLVDLVDETLEPGDRLILQGAVQDIVSFSEQCNLKLLERADTETPHAATQDEGSHLVEGPRQPEDGAGSEGDASQRVSDEGAAESMREESTADKIESGPNVLVEVQVSPTSRLVGESLKELDFRRRFGVQVVALRRTGQVIRAQLGSVVLDRWDTLLLFGDRGRIQALAQSEALVNLQEHGLQLELRRGWWLNAGILIAVVTLASLGVLPILTASIYGAVAMLVTRRLTMQEAYHSINWTVIFLVAAILPMGKAMVNTGLATLIGDQIARLGAQSSGTFLILSILYLTTTILTEIMSNNSTAVLMVPIALSVANIMGLEPFPLIITIAFAASASFLTPMGYKTNAMVYGPGGYRFMDYIRFGAPLKLVFWVVSVVAVPWVWPLGQV